MNAIAHPPLAIRCSRWWLWLACWLVVLPVLAQEGAETPADQPQVAASGGVITAIEFSGNHVTRRQILAQEMLVKVGDVADPALVEASRQAIMDLGLFVAVYAELKPADGGVVLHIIVKEKYYILPVPKLNRDEQNRVSIGGELSFDNLAGLNQQLKYRYENEQAPGLSRGNLTTDLISYSYPRMFGTTYNLQASVTDVTSPAEVVTGDTLTSLYRLKAWAGNLQLSHWLNRTGPSRGWQVGGGVVVRQNSYDYLSGVPESSFRDARAVGITLLGQFTRVHDYLFSRSGVEYGYNMEYGDPDFGSDSHYTRHDFYYRKYWLLEGRPHENIDLQAKLGLSSGNIFPTNTYAYSLGGSRSLRGYDSGTFTGKAYALVNVQYLRPFFGYYPLRGAVFLDIGNAYPNYREFHLGDLHWDAGLGFRLRLKSFVKMDLRVDVSYAYDTGEVKVFAGSKEMF